MLKIKDFKRLDFTGVLGDMLQTLYKKEQKIKVYTSIGRYKVCKKKQNKVTTNIRETEARIMGISASQGRFLNLTARKSDVEFQGQQINQARTRLSNESASITTIANSEAMPELHYRDVLNDQNEKIGTEPDVERYTAEMAKYTEDYNKAMASLAPVQQMDKKLELQLKQLDTEQQAISTEIDAVNKVIDKNIEGSFKTFA